MSKTFFKRSFKQKKYGKYGRWSETRKFFVSHWYKTKNKNILKTYFNFLIFLRSNLYISFCICLCFFRYYLLCMLELIHFFTLVYLPLFYIQSEANFVGTPYNPFSQENKTGFQALQWGNGMKNDWVLR